MAFEYSRLGGFTNPCNTVDVFYHQHGALFNLDVLHPLRWCVPQQVARVFFLVGFVVEGQGLKLLVSLFGNQACGNYRGCNLLLIEGYLLARIVVVVMVWLVN